MTKKMEEESLKFEQKEKSRNELFTEFKNSLESHGVENLEARIEDEKLILEQKLGSGINGLGYDKNEKSLWLCLDQNKQNIEQNQRWNANTVMDLKKEFPGIIMEESRKGKIKVTISHDHPVATLSALLERSSQVNLCGGFNKWRRGDNPFIKNKETRDLEVEIEWDGKPVESKIAITESPCNWNSGKWKNKASQKLEAEL